MTFSVPGYQLSRGSPLDRSQLVNFMGKTFAELADTKTFSHLADTVERHLSSETPLWWVIPETMSQAPIAGLWLGNAIDQQRGDRLSYILMLYVLPAHRRRGIATALMQTAQGWAEVRGDLQIGLQVFAHNTAARALYQKLGYEIQSLWLTKSLPCEGK